MSVSRKFQECFNNVSRVFHVRVFHLVLSGFQEYMCQGSLNCYFKGVSRKFQRRFKEFLKKLSRAFHKNLKGVSSKADGC